MTELTLSEWLLRGAGAITFMILLSNFFAPRKLHYARNLAKLDPIVREIFIVHGVYIVLVLGASMVACFFFAEDLLGTSGIGRALVWFLAIFWSLRVVVQLFYYNREIKRRYPVFNVLFTGAFAFLAAVFVFLVIINPKP